VTYRVTLTNSGLTEVNGATYLDQVPAALSNVAASCGGATAGAVCGSQAVLIEGNRVSGVITSLPAGSSVTIIITGKAPNTPVRFVNIVTVSPPPGVVDSDPTDNVGGPVITQVRVAAVEGRVWLDTDHDRQRDPGEALLPGWTVQLLAPNGNGGYTVVGSAVTDATGFYRIGGVAPGANYRIVFRDPVGGIIYGSPVDGETAATQGPGNGTFNPATSSNATLRGGIIQSIELVEGVTVIEQSLPIDPTGVVYDSQTRLPVAGAQVCVDGPAGFNPAVQLVSGQRCVTTGPDGFYQFLFTGIGAGAAPAGTYTLAVTPPSGYSIPSVITPNPVFAVPGPVSINTLIQQQSTAPALGQPTRYHFQFTFDSNSGGVINNHIPVDPPPSGALLLNKVASTSVAELGDSVQYTLRVRNTASGPVAGATIRDSLPAGFRFIPGTLRVNGAAASQPVGVGPQLAITLPTLPGGSTTEVTYYVRIGVGSAEGDGINRAQVYVGNTPRSNLAAAKVQIRGGVFGSDACIVGKVFVDCNGDHVQNNVGGSNELGIPGVRIVMETGAFAVTDAEGKYNICPVSPITHVLRIDKRTLPVGSKIVPSSNRNAGDGSSLFVDITKGELARADFVEGSCSAPVLDQVKARRAQAGPANTESEGPESAPLRIQGSAAPFQPQQILPQPRQGDTKSAEGK
jgi:large repetitive protein